MGEQEEIRYVEERRPGVVPPDAWKDIAETKRTALEALTPTKDDIPSRIPLITVLRGKKPDIYAMYRAAVLWELRRSLRKNEAMRWDLLDPIIFLKEHAPSIDGLRSKQIVEVARSVTEERRRWEWPKLFSK